MFTITELQSIATLLQRVDLKGNEAITVANLQVKINQLLQPKPTEEPTPSSEAKNEENRNKKA